jgi:hypothetical protein
MGNKGSGSKKDCQVAILFYYPGTALLLLRGRGIEESPAHIRSNLASERARFLIPSLKELGYLRQILLPII